nr:hypothetical protein Datr000107 [Darna trima granulovirus]
MYRIVNTESSSDVTQNDESEFDPNSDSSQNCLKSQILHFESEFVLHDVIRL